MTDESTTKTKEEQRPLLPATTASAAIVGIPLASVLAFGGWAGQKLVDIDER